MRTRIAVAAVALVALAVAPAHGTHGDRCRTGEQVWHASEGTVGFTDGRDCVGQENPNALDRNTWFLNGGHDSAEGGPDSDWIEGGNGDDLIDLGSHSDTGYGWDGNDYIDEGENSGSAQDTIFGNNGSDIILVGRGFDFARGGNDPGTFDIVEHRHCPGDPADDLAQFEQHRHRACTGDV